MLRALRAARVDAGGASLLGAGGADDPFAPGGALLLLKGLLKLADISNVARPWATARAWTARVADEMHAQGDAERAQLGEDAPSAPMFDRARFRSLSHSSAGFVDFVAGALYEVLAPLSPQTAAMAAALARNRALSQEEIDAIA